MVPALTILHVLAALSWVGGIFFAYMALRPASLQLEPPLRLALWRGVLGRFFPWVWAFVLVLLASGHALMALGAAPASRPVIGMAGLGWVMALLFAYLYFVPFKSLRRAVAVADTAAAAAAMARIRPVVATNLVLGLTVSALGASARFW